MPRLPFSRAALKTCIMLMALVGLTHRMILPQLDRRMRESMSAWWGWADSGSVKKMSAPKSSMHMRAATCASPPRGPEVQVTPYSILGLSEREEGRGEG